MKWNRKPFLASSRAISRECYFEGMKKWVELVRQGQEGTNGIES
jgi:hypothetical protein